MSIISGYQKIKKYMKSADGYQLISHWTSSDTVEMNDGSTLEHRISNVDNTSDQDKPISIAQQNALNQKADIASPAFTGIPTAPTPPSGTNTSQIATTTFVQTAVSNGITASGITIDSNLSSASSNPVENKVIHAALESKLGKTENAASASKLATARTLRTNLASTSTASFDGSANITPGVTGTLPVANGGTGKTTLTSGQVLVGNGTSAVSQRAIDTTSGGTAGSTSLITSGAVKAGLDSCAKTIKSGTATSSPVTFSIDSTKNYLLIGKGGTASYETIAFITKGYLISVKGSLFSLKDTTVTVGYPGGSIYYEVIQL